MRRPSLSEDKGDTLIEVLVSVVIMGIAAVAIFGGLLTSVSLSSYHRHQSSAGTSVRNFGESVVKYAAGTGYTACATTATYSPASVGYTAPSGLAASAVSVQYWIGSAWTSTGCTSSTDTGVQKVSIQVTTSADSRATELLTIIVRKPCASGSSCS
jgi:prepilin-type N-terminal cleavage/methylation domain-containing protein